jgi:tetratricopeptide (TPR) repeat protein
MSAASLSPAEFAPSVGYLGPQESTPYYPTGDLRGDRSVAFTIAMNCIDDLEVNSDDVQIATKLFELAQALSDLGLREYSLNMSGHAADILERLYAAEPNKYRLRLASVLSLRANILFDLNQNEEARNVADRAVTLHKDQKDSQAEPFPELAYALLNYAVLLCSMDLKDESAAIAFELLCEDDTQPDMKDIFALCKLCLSNTRIGTDNDMGLEMAEELINLTCTSSDADSQTILVGALLAKSKILLSRGENDAAPDISAEAVMLLRRMSAGRPVFLLFLAHALDTHAHHLSEAMRKAESYSIRREAVELWQMLKVTAGSAVARSLAWSLFKLAQFRSSKDDDKNARREELQLAESAVDAFREVVPMDLPGLGDALYNVAARMLELDYNRDASTYAEESVQYFRDASAEDPKYADDLIASLSLASSCLTCTERADDAFEYAKQAVKVQHERQCVKDKQYNGLLQKLLMDAVMRASEIGKEVEAFPFFQELQALGGLGGMYRSALRSVNWMT